MAYQMKTAKFLVYRDLYSFDFSESKIDKYLIRDLHHCDSIEDSQNSVFVGGSGTEKIHLAAALRVRAIQRHQYPVRF